MFSAVLIMILATIGFATIGFAFICKVTYRHFYPKPFHNPCNQCHGLAVKMTEYFKKNGSRNPEEMAYAVLNTSSPRLLAAIAVKESNANSSVRRSGYKNRHDGAFQVNGKHWGKVSTHAVEQALQAENILKDLTTEMPIKKALSQYGGDSTEKYQRKILAELPRVP
jgi:hypothetical protein